MSYEFKKIADLELVNEVPEGANVLIETEGATKRLPSAAIKGSVDVVAEVGQTIVVKSVDENGEPTEWEAVDLPVAAQADWEQNDETQLDYIKNRTHYTDVVEAELLTLTATRTSDTELSLPIEWQQVYDHLLYNGEFYAKVAGMRLVCGTSFSESNGYCYLTINGIKNSLPPDTSKSITIAGEGFTTDTYDVEFAKAEEIVHKIDEKYIPDTIPKISGSWYKNQIPVSNENGGITWKAFSLSNIDGGHAWGAVPVHFLGMTLKLPTSINETTVTNIHSTSFVEIIKTKKMVSLIGKDEDNAIAVPITLTHCPIVIDEDPYEYFSGLGYGINYSTGDSAGVFAAYVLVYLDPSETVSSIDVTVKRIM